MEQRRELEDWIGAHETVTVAEVRDHSEERYGVVYQAKHSSYELREAGGLRYHRSEKGNPQRDAAQVLARRVTAGTLGIPNQYARYFFRQTW